MINKRTTSNSPRKKNDSMPSYNSKFLEIKHFEKSIIDPGLLSKLKYKVVLKINFC